MADIPAADTILGSSLLIFGAGGHGRVVADAALLAGRWTTILASDRNPNACTGELLGGILLTFPHAYRQGDQAVHVAIGVNAARQREAEYWGCAQLVSVIHPGAVVSKFSLVEAGCFVAACAVIAAGASVGVGAIVNHGAMVDHDVKIGAFSHVAPNAVLGGNAVLGRRVLLGSGSVVLPGKRINDDIVVGAGSVVREDLIAPGTYAGVPARKLR